jgi:hypothetical protein
MEVPFREDLDVYPRNSSFVDMQHMTIPLLLIGGDADGPVVWLRTKEVYNAARRAQNASSLSRILARTISSPSELTRSIFTSASADG